MEVVIAVSVVGYAPVEAQWALAAVRAASFEALQPAAEPFDVSEPTPTTTTADNTPTSTMAIRISTSVKPSSPGSWGAPRCRGPVAMGATVRCPGW